MKTKNTEVIVEKVMEVDSTEVRPKKGDKPKNNGSEIPNWKGKMHIKKLQENSMKDKRQSVAISKEK